MALLQKFLVVFIIIKISSAHTIPIRCEDLNIPNAERSELCWYGIYLQRPVNTPAAAESFPNVDFQEVQRRNAELSSALNYLYGNKDSRFPGKRNPELSTALLNYLNRN